MKVVRTDQTRVEDLPPFIDPPFLDLKGRIPAGRVGHNVKIGVLLRGPAQVYGQEARTETHVHRGTSAKPAHVVAPETAPAQGRVGLAEADHAAEEPKDILVDPEPIPVQPAGLVVLVVRVVVATLRLQELVAGAKHGRAVRQEQQAAQVLGLALAQLQNLGRDPIVPIPPEFQL